MNEFAILAVVVTPAIVVVLGDVAVCLQVAAGRRYDAVLERRGTSNGATRS